MKFFVPIKPVPQRLIKAGKRLVRPPEYKAYKEAIRLYANQYRPDKPYEGAINLSIKIYLRSKEKPAPFFVPAPDTGNPLLVNYHTSKADGDNYLKGIQDALTGVFYKDDCQVSQVLLIKFSTSELEGVEIEVIEL